MLSGDGHENVQNKTVGLISKKTALHLQHNFFLHFFAVVLHQFNMKLPSYTFYGGEVVCVPVHYCSFTPWWPLAFLIFSVPP